MGAGFSKWAKTKNGEDIPTDDLKEMLVTDLLKYDKNSAEYRELIQYTLSKVCQFVQYEKSQDHLTDFLTEIFKDVKHSPFHYNLTKYHWRKIYTTNIDDIVENIYRENNFDLKVQNSGRLSTSSKKDRTEYIKLHGCVNNPSAGYTFSSEEYIDSTLRSQDYRFNSLCLDMQTGNFILIGTNFDEFNIDFYLKLYENTGYYSSKGHLIFISPNPSLYLTSRIRDLKGIIIKWTAEQFLNFLNELNYKEDRVNHLKKSLLYGGFLNFEKLRQDYQPNTQYDSHLYSGYEPKWQDVLSEWDFIHPITPTILRDIKNTGMDKKICVFSIVGKAYVGKTCALLRIAAELYKNGFEVISFNGRKFDIYPLLDYIEAHKTKNRFALIVDNASYYYYIAERIAKTPLDNRQLIIVTTSRPFYHWRRRYYLVDLNFREYILESKLDEYFSKNIIQKLREKGYLGELTKLKTEEEQVGYFTDKNDLMSAMLEITYGKGFIRRFMKDIQPLLHKDSVERDSLINLAIFDKAELPYFPLELVPTLYNINADYLKNKIDNFIKDKSSSEISIRSGFFTDSILKAARNKEIKANILDILIAISPQVDEYTPSYWKIIFESLSKGKILRKRFRFSHEDIKNLLYELKEYYDNISYYWLQRGLSEQAIGDFEKALNHFRQAEAIRPKSYHIRHVIGRNFLKQANATSDFAVAKPLFEEGEKILLALIKEKELSQVRSYSVHSYLYEKINFVQKFNLEVSNRELKTMFRFLEKLIEKDKNDVMAKHMSNYFYQFLKSRNRLDLVKINIFDLSRYMYLFRDIDIAPEDILEYLDMD